MVPPRLGICLAAACCALACGDRPDLPGRAESNGAESSGAGSASGSLDRPDDAVIDEVLNGPRPPAEGPGEQQASADAGVRPAAPADDGDEEPPAPGAQTAVACAEDGGNCFIVNIALSDAAADSCIQLSLDDCEGSAQAGLPVDLPVSWRLGAASVNRSADDCTPGKQFDPRTGSTIIDASGSIDWNVMTRVPSEVVIDVTLEPASTAVDRTPIRVTNTDLVAQLGDCD